MGETEIQIYRHSVQISDIIRVCIIAVLVIFCTLITAISFSRSITFLNYQLFFIPILYAAYFYPRKGLYLACLCGIAFQMVGYYYSYPDPVAMMSVTAGAILFILIAVIIAYFIEQIRAGEVRYHSVFKHSQLGIVLFDSTDFTIKQTNDKFIGMLHYTSQDILTKSFSGIFFTPQEQTRFLERIKNGETIDDFETRLMTKEGDGCWTNLSWSRIDKKTISCTVININARKLAEKMNNDNMMKYRAADRAFPDQHPDHPGRADPVCQPVIYCFIRLQQGRNFRKGSLRADRFPRQGPFYPVLPFLGQENPTVRPRRVSFYYKDRGNTCGSTLYYPYHAYW